MPRVLDTRARTVWPKGHAPKRYMKGTVLMAPAGVAARYSTKLRGLTQEMVTTTKRELLTLYSHPDVRNYFASVNTTDAAEAIMFAMDAISPASQARILTNKLKDRFEQLFGAHAKPYAESMADETNDASQTATEQSLRELSKGLTISTEAITPQMEEFLKASIANNVSLIKSIPSEFFRDVQQAVLSSITDGTGKSSLDDFFKNQDHDLKFNNEWDRRANNIALDQTRKTYNGLNRDRMKNAGVNKFEWVHTGGGLHPREHHLDPWPAGLNGGVFSYDKLPVIDLNTGETGIPGQAINCKCVQRPVVEFDE